MNHTTPNTQGMEVKISLRLPAAVRKKGKWFISSCPPLDVHSQGHTHDEAARNLVEALTEFLLSCFERGTLNEVLRDAGFVGASEPLTPRAARKLPTGLECVDIPLPFVIQDRVAHGRDHHPS